MHRIYLLFFLLRRTICMLFPVREPTVFYDKCTPCHRCKYQLAWPLPWRWKMQIQAGVYLTEACCPLWCAGWTRLTMVKEVQRPAAPGQATSWATPGETPSSSIAFHPAQNSVSPSFLHSNYHNIYSGTVCFCPLCQVFLSVSLSLTCIKNVRYNRCFCFCFGVYIFANWG